MKIWTPLAVYVDKVVSLNLRACFQLVFRSKSNDNLSFTSAVENANRSYPGDFIFSFFKSIRIVVLSKTKLHWLYQILMTCL